MANQKLEALRARMAQEGMDAYMVPTSDFHESEYVGEHFKARSYLSGFTGSAGVCVVLKDEAELWTDGRYFIQAENQLRGTGIKLMKIAEPGVPTVEQFLAEKLPEGGCLGYDGRVVNTRTAQNLEKALAGRHARFAIDKDLVGEIWTDRPALSAKPAFRLTDAQAGVTAKEKLALIRGDMAENGADVLLLPTLGEIAWLLNLRGADIAYNPYLLAFAAVEKEQVLLFAQKKAVSDEVEASLAADGVKLMPYDGVYDYIAGVPAGTTVWTDETKLNFAAFSRFDKNVNIVDKPASIVLRKAIKNPVEIENTKKAHILDGVAFTRFMKWVKENVGKIPMDETTASDYLEQRRAEQEGFLELSFDTICAYNANAAMMHYSAKPGSAAELKPEGFLLVDSGGQYLTGTTDITRTMALGPVSREWKEHYTAVLRGMINLARANFLYGCRGINLDILARGPMWDIDLDYKCGTGHGVAHIGGVHEAPNGFRWRIVPERNDSCVLEEGMITTDEPGIYVEGSHGIRTENELLCVKGNANEYGQFMHFEALTMAPIDLDAVLPENMTAAEKKYLNDYHALVREKLSPYFDEEERRWLAHVTRAI